MATIVYATAAKSCLRYWKILRTAVDVRRRAFANVHTRAIGRIHVRVLAALYFETLLLAATFLACGLAAGYFAHDRAQGLIVGVSVWLLLLFGLDLVALFAARWSAIQTLPDLWVALLMLIRSTHFVSMRCSLSNKYRPKRRTKLSSLIGGSRTPASGLLLSR